MKMHRLTKYHCRRQTWLHGIKLEENLEVCVFVCVVRLILEFLCN